MKNLKIRILSMLLILVILSSSLVIPSFAAESAELQYNYSTEYNSGKRDEICTTLNGTSADDYYTGSYTYDLLVDLSSSALQSALHTLMAQTHTTITTYNDCRDLAIRTDCELEANKGVTDTTKQTVVLLYTSYTATRSQWNGWNREHVWPQSLGKTENTPKGGGADLHHVRPSDKGVNSSRGNKPYNDTDRSGVKYGTDPAVGVLGGYYNKTYFEPLDNVKGDVARICLYVWIRWGSEWGADSITELFPDTDVLLEWMELDPVDTWEMGRNEVVGSIQGNRNVFIDYPEYAWLVLGEEVPDDLVTPSGEAMDSGAGNSGSGNTGSGNSGNVDTTCQHTDTEILNGVEATCGDSGYTGDTYCKDCDEKLSDGQVTEPTGDHAWGNPTVILTPTAAADGKTRYTCTVCAETKIETVPYVPSNPDPDPTPDPDPVPPVVEVESYWGCSYGTDAEKIIAILSKNTLYSFVLGMLADS